MGTPKETRILEAVLEFYIPQGIEMVRIDGSWEIYEASFS